MKNEDGKPLKLYEVELGYVYVLAIDEFEAEQHVRDSWYDIDQDLWGVHETRSFYSGWEGCIPFGDRDPNDPDATVDQIVRRIRESEAE